jgi:hypothetical protein
VIEPYLVVHVRPIPRTAKTKETTKLKPNSLGRMENLLFIQFAEAAAPSTTLSEHWSGVL